MVTDYRAVMDLVLKGWSVRQITATVGCSHSTVQTVRKVLQAEQIATRAQIAGLNDEAVAVLFHDGRSTSQGVFVPIDFDSAEKAPSGRAKTTLQVLRAKYTSAPALPGQRYYSYERFRQLVAQHADATGVTTRIVHASAHTMQVDWAGSKMRLFDPTGATSEEAQCPTNPAHPPNARVLLDTHPGVTRYSPWRY